jgi:hypothetical protein
MSETLSLNMRRAMVVLCSLSALAGAAYAQTAPTPPPAPTDKPPNAETPPGGIARGVVPPPKGVDPSMIQPPPANVKPTMPVIKPQGTSR